MSFKETQKLLDSLSDFEVVKKIEEMIENETICVEYCIHPECEEGGVNIHECWWHEYFNKR